MPNAERELPTETSDGRCGYARERGRVQVYVLGVGAHLVTPKRLPGFGARSRCAHLSHHSPSQHGSTGLCAADHLPPNGRYVIDAAAGIEHTVLLTSDGALYTFGSNEFGQLGLGDTRARTAPARVELAKDITTVACGGT